MTKEGFRVMRFELRGFGDSEGEDYRRADFDTEVHDNVAAFDYLAKRHDITQVFVYGHSTGGMIASLLAQKRKIAGLITSCTIGRTFYERMVETLRIQGEFAGDSAVDIENDIKDLLFLTTSIAQGESLETIRERSPALDRFITQKNRIMDNRTEEYWRQQLNLNLSDIYSKVTNPVLIIYGLSDYLTQLTCHEHIRDVLMAAGNTDVQLHTFPNLDHRYGYANDKKTSYQNAQSRSFAYNPVATEAIIQWLKKQRHSSSSLNM
jgi:pimeloyl-ACP methyl ester carboxylesterase